MDRAILHLNFVNLAVGLERLRDSSLAERPLIIAPTTDRALVHAASREAEGDGVRRGMPLAAARRRCPRAVVRPPRPERYRRFMARCTGPALAFSPLVEPGRGMGHLYLDLSGSRRLLGPAPAMARRLQQELHRATGLSPAWGLATSRMVARVAGRLARPDGGCVVAPGTEQEFLAPLPLALLPGLQGHDLARLGELNIRTVAQARCLSLQELAVVCGQRARQVQRLLHAIDPRPVRPLSTPPGPEPLFIHRFSPDTNQEDVVLAALHDLVLRAGRRLRRQGRGCRRLAVHLEYSDGLEVVRQAAARDVAADNHALHGLAVTALYRCWRRRVRLRRLALSCSGLRTLVRQLSLFEDIERKNVKSMQISMALDAIYQRFGAAMPRPATLVCPRRDTVQARGRKSRAAP